MQESFGAGNFVFLSRSFAKQRCQCFPSNIVKENMVVNICEETFLKTLYKEAWLLSFNVVKSTFVAELTRNFPLIMCSKFQDNKEIKKIYFQDQNK